LLETLNVSPPLGIKARKIVNAERTLNYNKDIIEEMETFDIEKLLQIFRLIDYIIKHKM